MVDSGLNSSIWLNQDREVIQEAIESIGTPVGLVEVREDGSFAPIAFNKQLTRYYGFDFSEFVDSGKAIFEFKPKERVDIPDALKYLERAVQNYKICVEMGRPVEFETNFSDAKTGKVSWSVNTMVPIKDGDRVARILVTMVDTSYKHADASASAVNSLSVCAWCEKRVKDSDTDDWESVLQYFHRNGVSVSHGICNGCMSDVESLMVD